MGFPVTLKKGDQTRVANTPADRVSAEFDGFREVHDVDITPDAAHGLVVNPVDPTGPEPVVVSGGEGEPQPVAKPDEGKRKDAGRKGQEDAK